MSGSPLQTSGGTNYYVKTIICLTNIMHYNQCRDSHNTLLISFIVCYIILLRSKLLQKSIHIIENLHYTPPFRSLQCLPNARCRWWSLTLPFIFFAESCQSSPLWAASLGASENKSSYLLCTPLVLVTPHSRSFMFEPPCIDCKLSYDNRKDSTCLMTTIEATLAFALYLVHLSCVEVVITDFLRVVTPSRV